MRGSLLVLTWIVATVLATGLAWAGVRSVVDDVAAPLPVPAATSGQVRSSERAATNERSPEPSSDTSELGSRPESTERAQAAETVRTFELRGGTATVAFSPSGVEVLSAVPKAGFSADVEPENGRTRVDFESDDHRSRLEVWWNSKPRHAIDERDDDDGGHDDSGSDDSGHHDD